MLNTPIPDHLIESDDERTLPPGAGVLIAMIGSILLWGAIYLACVLAF